MSRRQRLRAANDKRATALDLARLVGHGTPLPSSDEPEEPVGEDWNEAPDETDHRTQIGPLDCRNRGEASHG